MLRENCVNPPTSLVSMLGGVKEVPFGPEGLDTRDNNTGPDFTCGFDESNGSDVVKAGRV